MYHVGENLFLNIQQMAPGTIREDMSAIYWETDQDPVAKCIAFVRNAVDVVLGFVLCV